MKLKALAFLTIGVFGVASAFAGDKACCAHTGPQQAKLNCSATFANINLSADQKAKMEKLAADCEKGGCNEQTMAKMEQRARKILNQEQFAQWKAACTGGHHMDKKQS